MTKGHGRKSRARKTSRSRGAAYTAAQAGTLHQHTSGPTDKDLQPDEPGRWGIDAAPDLRTASALISARIEQCAPCQTSLAAKLLDEDPIVLAVTAGTVYRLHEAHEPDGGGLTSDVSQFFLMVVRASAPGKEHIMLRCVELLLPEDRAALLEESLGLWTFYGTEPTGLLQGNNSGTTDASRAAIAVTGGNPESGGSPEPSGLGTVADPSGLAVEDRSGGQRPARHRPVPGRHLPARPAALGMAPASPPRDQHSPRRTGSMTESIEQHAEGAARSLVELVRTLQYRGIEYPGEAHRVHSYLTRCAGELRTAIELIEASVQQLQDKEQLMSDYRGEPLDDVLQRFTESSDAAKDLAGALHGRLSTAYSAIGRVAYKDGPGEQESATGS
ncbi:hypothetical protein ACGFWE_42895 [Streptomyces sp. NPDC048523]|uniref:hypothetical protein n=1 Tax=Streptomyces sp. NPDC048523 TaxID=3365567 RepID=UPI0037140B56